MAAFLSFEMEILNPKARRNRPLLVMDRQARIEREFFKKPFANVTVK